MSELLSKQNPGVLKIENWLEVGMISSNLKEIFNRLQIRDNLQEIAVVWNRTKDLLVKCVGKLEEIDEVEKILSSNTNPFEPLAISFRYGYYPLMQAYKCQNSIIFLILQVRV